MNAPKHTPGPLAVRIQDKWPFHIDTVNADGDVVFRDEMPCHSSRDQSLTDTLNCVHFDAAVRSDYATANARAVADATLRAAAPEMLEALEMVMRRGRIDDSEEAMNQVAAAIAKAKKDQSYE